MLVSVLPLLLGALQQPAAAPATPLARVMNPGRIRDDQYRVVMFRLTSDTASGFTLMQRAVARADHGGTPAIRVHEEDRAKAAAVTIDIDAKTLRPITYESTSGDTLAVKAQVDGDSLRITETRRGVATRSVAAAGPGVYFSNSFSELVQANDFGRTPRITFTTLTPGASPNTFVVERVGRRSFPPGGDVWVLKFTRIDATGASQPGGYRYVDVHTGKVLFFTTELDSPNAFTYQVLPLR